MSPSAPTSFPAFPAIAPEPGVCDVIAVRGADAPVGAAPDVVFEVPHGATRAVHFDALAATLRSPVSPDLRDFFFVNTDVGAPELAVRTAERFVAGDPTRSAVVLRCLLPRTLVDCNRAIDRSTRPAASAAGEVTPGLPPWIRDPADVEALVARHAAYQRIVDAALDASLSRGGRCLMTHTYAPRSVDVPVDDRIVEHLRNAYRPETVGTWPLRSPVDFIVNAPDGAFVADAGLLARAESLCAAAGLATVRNGAYTLHPATAAHARAVRHAGRTLCLEVRRDLLVREFTPFAEMHADAAKTDAVAAVLATALEGVSARRD